MHNSETFSNRLEENQADEQYILALHHAEKQPGELSQQQLTYWQS